MSFRSSFCFLVIDVIMWTIRTVKYNGFFQLEEKNEYRESIFEKQPMMSWLRMTFKNKARDQIRWEETL